MSSPWAHTATPCSTKLTKLNPWRSLILYPHPSEFAAANGPSTVPNAPTTHKWKTSSTNSNLRLLKVAFLYASQPSNTKIKTKRNSYIDLNDGKDLATVTGWRHLFHSFLILAGVLCIFLCVTLMPISLPFSGSQEQDEIKSPPTTFASLSCEFLYIDNTRCHENCAARLVPEQWPASRRLPPKTRHVSEYNFFVPKQ
jgi:hypothetical protein